MSMAHEALADGIVEAAAEWSKRMKSTEWTARSYQDIVDAQTRLFRAISALESLKRDCDDRLDSIVNSAFASLGKSQALTPEEVVGLQKEGDELRREIERRVAPMKQVSARDLER